MWYIYTIEYYTAENNNDSLILSGKWMDLENIILSKVNQTQKDNYLIYSLISDFWHKAKKPSLQFTIPENLDNNDDTKKDIKGSNLQGK